MIRKITAAEPLKILGFTDMHLDNNEPCDFWTRRLFRETAKAEKPDLIAFVGDNITGGGNLERTKAFVGMMDELRIPWCPILGNHEGDNPFSVTRSEMADIFRASPYCLLPKKKNAFGDTDYAVPLESDDGRVVHKLIFMDSGCIMSESDRQRLVPECTKKAPDDFLKPEQIAWYVSCVHEDTCPSTLFVHVPLSEFKTAGAEGEILSGANRESICVSPYNSGMFDAIVREGKTGRVICGHDHVNDSHMLYKGIRLIYNRMSGFSSYNAISKKVAPRLLQGASVYTVHCDGKMTFSDIFYEDMYPEYMPEIYKVIRK